MRARTAELARAANVARGFGDWRRWSTTGAFDAVAIAVPPDLQPEIARRALALGKPVFVEKPLAADLAGARGHARAAQRSGRPGGHRLQLPRTAVVAAARRRSSTSGRARALASCGRDLERGEPGHAPAPTELEDAAAAMAAACSAISSATAFTISNGSAGRSPGSAAGCFLARRRRRDAASRWRSPSHRVPAAACR